MENILNTFNFQGGYGLNILLAVGFIWATAWKGLGLWNAAKNRQQYWFVAMLIINTLGILEIAYLFWFAKKRLTLKDLQNLIKGK